MKFIVVLMITMLVVINGCKHEIPGKPIPKSTGNPTGNPGAPCDPSKVYYEKDIQPILNQYCAYSGCHDAGTAEDGVVLNSYANTIQTGDVRPNNPGGSDLYERIVDNDPDDRMPPALKPQLTQDQINLIAKWINQGALDLRCASGCDTVAVTYSTHISQLMTNNCIGCHNTPATGGGIILNDFNTVKDHTQNGKLICAIEQSTGCSPMPKGGAKLDACKIIMIKKWQQAGYPN